MEDELRKAIGDWLNYQNEKQVELDKKYPPSPPNDVCKIAYVKGILIENSFNPHVGCQTANYNRVQQQIKIPSDTYQTARSCL